MKAKQSLNLIKRKNKSGLVNEEVSHLHKGERETRIERRRKRQFLGVFSPSCRDQAWFKKKKEEAVRD